MAHYELGKPFAVGSFHCCTVPANWVPILSCEKCDGEFIEDHGTNFSSRSMLICQSMNMNSIRTEKTYLYAMVLFTQTQRLLIISNSALPHPLQHV